MDDLEPVRNTVGINERVQSRIIAFPDNHSRAKPELHHACRE
jgi:hypothetical protein